MQLHVVILTLKFVYSGDGNQMLSKGIFALLAFLTVQHYNNHNLCESDFAVGWSNIGLGYRAVCRGTCNCYVLGLGDIFSVVHCTVFLMFFLFLSTVKGPLLT